jgi:hypothetical protein
MPPPLLPPVGVSGLLALVVAAAEPPDQSLELREETGGRYELDEELGL